MISTGLSVARRMLLGRPAGDRHVLLVSDLVDGVIDLPKLQSVVAQYQREQIDLRVITVKAETNGRPQSNASFLAAAERQLRRPGGDADDRSGSSSCRRRRRSTAPLVALVALIAVLAAAYELVLHPLTWRRA